MPKKQQQPSEPVDTTPKQLVEYVCPSCGAPYSAVVDVGDTRPRLCLIHGYGGDLVGCRVYLREIGRGYKLPAQRRA